MIVLPAIDIQAGRCVRLARGDFATVHQVADDPLETAACFQKDGAVWLHMVDLDGALQGSRINAPIFLQVAAQSGLKVELGGGIRDMASIEYYLSRGIQRVVLGSAALSDPTLVSDAVRRFGERIAVGIDVKNGRVATRGWLDVSDVDEIEMAKRMEEIGVKVIIFTDISRDGMLTGPPAEQLNRLSRAVTCKIVASGGVSSLSDITALRDAGMHGAICGKSLYAGALNLKRAIETAGDQHAG